MQISQLRYFIEICRQENVTRAAEQLHIAQPSLSIAIRKLEEELGIKLFYRDKGRLHLTKEGQYFLTHATDLVGRFDALESDMLELQKHEKRLKVGVSMISAYLYRQLFWEFSSRYPELRLELRECSANELEQLLLDDQLDLGIGMLTERTGDRFHSIPLDQVPVVFCVRADHPLAKLDKITVEDLRDQEIIMAPDDSHHTAEQMMERFRRAGIVPRVRLWTVQFLTSTRYVLEHGIGSIEVEEFAKSVPEMVRIPFDPPLLIPLGLFWRHGYYLRSNALRFLEFVSEYYKEPSAGREERL